MRSFLRWKLLDGTNGRGQSTSRLGWRKGWRLVTAEWQRSERTLLNFGRLRWLGAERERGRKQLEERERSGKHESGKPTCDSVVFLPELMLSSISQFLSCQRKTNIFYDCHWPCKTGWIAQNSSLTFRTSILKIFHLNHSQPVWMWPDQSASFEGKDLCPGFNTHICTRTAHKSW